MGVAVELRRRAEEQLQRQQPPGGGLRPEVEAARLALTQLNVELEPRVRDCTTEALDLNQNAPCGCHSLGPDGLVLQLNATELTWLGYPQAEAEGRLRLPQLRTPESAERFRQLHPAFVRTGTTRQREWDLRRKDGTSITVPVTATAVRDAQGGFLHTRATVLDISERKHAEVQLRQLWSAVEQSPTVIVITDQSGTIEYVNPRFEVQTGYTAAEAVGRNPRLLQSGTHPHEFFANMWRTLLADQVWRGELCNKRKDGTLFWEATSIAPIRGEAGRLTHFVATKEDITERRQVAEELRQAKEAAEAANRAKSAFLANMSHEIRSPMNAILGFSQLVLRDPQLSSQHRQQLTTVLRSGEHLLEIINGILSTARLESGRATLNPAPFDLHRLLADLERMFSLRAQAKQLQFLVERDDAGHRYLVADETKLRQVIINLLGNAVKFTPDGGTITLRVATREEPQDWVRLAVQVQDTGVGIAPKDIAQLFRPFFQTQDGKQAAEGTGLGLAISRELVRLMGGDCTVRSQVGVGSIFQFDVRVHQAEQPVGGAQTTPHQRVLRLRPESPPCRVLVADDQPENRELLEQLLAPIGFALRTAVNGAAAVAQCAKWLPHVVLMDLRMPVMDGYEATRRIRAAHGPAVKIIALSAGVFAENRQQALAAGADAFLGKPFCDSDLLATLKELAGVDYLYADRLGAVALIAETAAAQRPTPEEVGRLPVECVDALREATCRGDYQQMLTLVDQIAVRDERAGCQLRQLVKRFDYVTLQQVLKPGASKA
jgi:PAS domain S-box-containing protein